VASLDTALIDITERDGVLHGTLACAPANALDRALVEALASLVDRFERGRARVLLLSSALPGCFAEDGAFLGTATSEQLADYHDSVRAPLQRLASCRRPSIAAIDGRALGLGLELAMACTLRFCSQGSRLGLPGVRLGAVPAAGGTQRLPRLIGAGRALDLMLTGRLIAGDEALRIGLVERLFYRDVAHEAQAAAEALAKTPSSAMALIMSCVEAAGDLPQEQGMFVERAALLSTLEDRAA
jgi:enoyl-CoA hydratase